MSLKEKKLIALCHGQLYQKRLIRVYAKNVYPHQFKEGDLILRMILLIQKDGHRKWMPNYEGPFIVKKAFFGGALILTNMDGDELP